MRLADLFPTLRDGGQPQSPAEQLQLVEMLNAAFGGRDLRPGKDSS